MEPLRRFLAHPWTVRVAGLVIGVVFVAAGLAKVGDPAAFAKQIHNFRMAPVWSENLIAVCLPWIEIVGGLALILRIRGRAAGWLLAGLMVLFTVAVAQATGRGLDIECGCFGTGDATQVGLAKLGENIGLTLVAFVSALTPRARAVRGEAGAGVALRGSGAAQSS